MVKLRGRDNHIIILLALIALLACIFPMKSTSFLLGNVAGHGIFESEESNENLTIAPETIQSIDFNLEEGVEFEIIFSLQVKNNLPVDVWFVTEDHYLLLINGAQFLFYIDGSEQEVVYTRNIVTLTEQGIYKLVVANKNNQTVETNIIYEIRAYFPESEEGSLSDSHIYFYSLILTVAILAIIISILILKTRKYKQALFEASKKSTSKKMTNKRKAKQNKKRKVSEGINKKSTTPKEKHIEPEVGVNETPKGIESLKSIEKESTDFKTDSPTFCGHCGKPISTTFCPYCGHKKQL